MHQVRHGSARVHGLGLLFVRVPSATTLNHQLLRSTCKFMSGSMDREYRLPPQTSRRFKREAPLRRKSYRLSGIRSYHNSDE